MPVAFSLRADYTEIYLGGVLAVGNTSLDVKAELDAGNGTIVVPDNDLLTLTVLDAYPPLKRVAVPEKPLAVVDTLDDLNVAQLRDEAKSVGVEKVGGLSKDELISAIHAAKHENVPTPTED